MSRGEINRAKNKLVALVNLCKTSGRLPQFFIQWKKLKGLESLNQDFDLFLSTGKLSNTSSINKLLKFLSKEEIFHLVETDKISWRQLRSLFVSLSGRYHDTKVLKLFLISCILRKENTFDSVRIFYKKYPSISKLCFNLLSEKKDFTLIKRIKRI